MNSAEIRKEIARLERAMLVTIPPLFIFHPQHTHLSLQSGQSVDAIWHGRYTG